MRIGSFFENLWNQITGNDEVPSHRNYTMRDYIMNTYYTQRYNYYRRFNPQKLKNISAPHKRGYNLLFADNFIQENWDTIGKDKWKIGEHWGLHHPERPNVYYGPPEVRNGKTYFTCKYKPKEFTVNGEKRVVPYEVSLLSSAKWFRTQYGRFECRMTLPDAPWSWPAFWMWGPTWPPEIDVIEAYGGKTGKNAVNQKMCLHFGQTDHSAFGSDAKNNKQQLPAWGLKIDEPENLGKNFYEFAMEWTPEKIEIFTNGIKVWQFTEKEIIERDFNNGPMWVVINNSIFNYNEHNSEYYSEFQVDYIRVYDFSQGR